MRLFYKEDLKNVLSLVKDGEQSLRKAAQRTGIPRTTLSRWVNNLSKFGSGRSTAISAETEGLLVEAIEYMGDLGWPNDQGQLKAIVLTFVQKTQLNNPFKNDIPNDKWCESF